MTLEWFKDMATTGCEVGTVVRVVHHLLQAVGSLDPRSQFDSMRQGAASSLRYYIQKINYFHGRLSW
jgi:hypothetical protein